MSRILVEVKRKHIKEGECSNPWSCPIANALLDMGYEYPCVGVNRILWDNGQQAMTLPRSVKRFIHRFDEEKPVKPFRFYLKG